MDVITIAWIIFPLFTLRSDTIVHYHLVSTLSNQLFPSRMWKRKYVSFLDKFIYFSSYVFAVMSDI
jgi:hypothetical protein